MSIFTSCGLTKHIRSIWYQSVPVGIRKGNVVVVYVKNVASMAIMSHKDCGLDYSPMSQMVRSHVKKLANEIDVLDQSEEGLHQRKGNTKNRFSKCDEWD